MTFRAGTRRGTHRKWPCNIRCSSEGVDAGSSSGFRRMMDACSRVAAAGPKHLNQRGKELRGRGRFPAGGKATNHEDSWVPIHPQPPAQAVAESMRAGAWRQVWSQAGMPRLMPQQPMAARIDHALVQQLAKNWRIGARACRRALAGPIITLICGFSARRFQTSLYENPRARGAWF